jgi:phosphopantothenoylcysteine decarboxylase/phosphopantothenate--cysteine ligase
MSFIYCSCDGSGYVCASFHKKNLNCRKLRTYIIPAESGELASGLIGQGRMAEPETILKVVKIFFRSNHEKACRENGFITAGLL